MIQSFAIETKVVPIIRYSVHPCGSNYFRYKFIDLDQYFNGEIPDTYDPLRIVYDKLIKNDSDQHFITIPKHNCIIAYDDCSVLPTLLVRVIELGKERVLVPKEELMAI